MTAMHNVILISMDTLRADVAYSGRCPAVDGLRKEGVTFTQAISSSPLTPVSHASILTGLQPPNHGVRHLLREQISPSATTLAEILSEHGYDTGAVVSSPGMKAWYGHSRGFGHYDDWIPPLADGRDALEVVDVKLRGTAMKRAPMVTERLLDWARASKRPMFLFAHYFDAHWPYEAPESVGSEAINPYEGEIAYMDRSVGDLMHGLEQLGVDTSNTITVCLSDHGEDLGGLYDDDHAGSRGHPEENGHGSLLFDTTQRVPLVIRAPSVTDSQGVVDAQVRLVDVMPTILDLLGLPCPVVDGTSLVNHMAGNGHDLPAYCETYYREELAASEPKWADLQPLAAIRYPDRKIIWEQGTDNIWLYDLVGDPGERNPFPLMKKNLT